MVCVQHHVQHHVSDVPVVPVHVGLHAPADAYHALELAQQVAAVIAEQDVPRTAVLGVA